MKKVLLAVLCAGLFFACGNKKQQETETLVDTAVCEEVVEAPVEEEVAPVEEAAPVAEKTTPKKTTTTAKKTTNNNNSGMKVADTKAEEPTLEQQAKSAANRVAGKAVEKAETEATTTIVNSGKKRR